MEINNLNNEHNQQQGQEFWNVVDTPFTESKEDIWTQLESKIDFEKTKTRTIKINWLKYSAAAVFVLLLCSTFFASFYTETTSTLYGETKSHLLPDGSKIHLNVNSKLTYNPYWFSFNRSLDFEGEAFFEVEKGKQFIVNSQLGTTEVLGTSFNIFSRENDYRVFCKTGLVKVTNSSTEENVLLNPNQFASIESKEIHFTKKANEKEQLAWQNDEFYFDVVSLEKVLKAFEQEYDVKINSNFSTKTDYIYTGFFQKQNNAFDALETLSLSLDLKVEKINEKEFAVFNAQ